MTTIKANIDLDSDMGSDCDLDVDQDPDPDINLESNIFGSGPYHNIIQSIKLDKSGTHGSGLYAVADIKANTIVWKNRQNGPAELIYKHINIDDTKSFTPNEMMIFIKYGYQISQTEFVSPLTQEEVDMDYSNYWNHSCEPNCLPKDEDTWVAISDIKKGDEVTIDYVTFDNNPWECIDVCECNTISCRKKITNTDYKLKYLQEKYKNHFLPYISKLIATFKSENKENKENQTDSCVKIA